MKSLFFSVAKRITKWLSKQPEARINASTQSIPEETNRVTLEENAVNVPPVVVTRIDRLKYVRSTFMRVRQIIARVDSYIDADQYVYVGVGIVTLLFGMVWYFDPGFLTFISLIGLFITTGDYFVQKLLPDILSNDWNEEKEKRYSKFCRNVAWLIRRLEIEHKAYKDWQDERPVSNFVFSVTSLALLAWVANQISGFCFAYLITIAIVLIPKFHRQSIIQQRCNDLRQKYNDLIVLEEAFEIISNLNEVLVNLILITIILIVLT